eukprot:3965108-Amphidinium_carterae.1
MSAWEFYAPGLGSQVIAGLQEVQETKSAKLVFFTGENVRPPLYMVSSCSGRKQHLKSRSFLQKRTFPIF